MKNMIFTLIFFHTFFAHIPIPSNKYMGILLFCSVACFPHILLRSYQYHPKHLPFLRDAKVSVSEMKKQIFNQKIQGEIDGQWCPANAFPRRNLLPRAPLHWQNLDGALQYILLH